MGKIASRIQVSDKSFDSSTINNQIRRIDDRLKMIEAERQKNIDKVTLFALKEAAKITNTASEKPVDRDWLNRFLNVSQDVSEEQMQEVWGKVLAGEVNKPGSFSLRSLELLKNLSQEEAELFRKYVQYRVTVDDDYFYVFPNEICNYGARDKKWGSSVFLRELRLVKEGIYTITFDLTKDEPLKFSYGGQQFFVYSKEIKAELNMNCFPFTSSGGELSTLIEISPVPEYFESIRNDIAGKGFLCKDVI